MASFAPPSTPAMISQSESAHMEKHVRFLEPTRSHSSSGRVLFGFQSLWEKSLKSKGVAKRHYKDQVHQTRQSVNDLHEWLHGKPPKMPMFSGAANQVQAILQRRSKSGEPLLPTISEEMKWDLHQEQGYSWSDFRDDDSTYGRNPHLDNQISIRTISSVHEDSEEGFWEAATRKCNFVLSHLPHPNIPHPHIPHPHIPFPHPHLPHWDWEFPHPHFGHRSDHSEDGREQPSQGGGNDLSEAAVVVAETVATKKKHKPSLLTKGVARVWRVFR
jgi:hypothetical protein